MTQKKKTKLSLRSLIGWLSLSLGILASLYLIFNSAPLEAEADPYWFTALLFTFIGLSTSIKLSMISGKKNAEINLISILIAVTVIVLSFSVFSGHNADINWPLGYHFSYLTLIALWPTIDILDLAFKTKA